MVITGEVVYLSIAFGLLQFALETITSIGVGIVLLGVAFQNKLKNTIAGISITTNPKIHIKDFIEVESIKCRITQFGLTNTSMELEDESKVMIPNVKFDEEIIKITSHKKPKILIHEIAILLNRFLVIHYMITLAVALSLDGIIWSYVLQNQYLFRN